MRTFWWVYQLSHPLGNTTLAVECPGDWDQRKVESQLIIRFGVAAESIKLLGPIEQVYVAQWRDDEKEERVMIWGTAGGRL